MADVGERAEVCRAAEAVIERLGGFDTCVNCAGVGIYTKLMDVSDEDHRKVFQTNYWSVVYGSTEAEHRLQDRGGAIIDLGSVASDVPSPRLSTYAASKHAVKGFTNSLRTEILNDHLPISVTLIKPSGVDTPFTDHALNTMNAAAALPPPIYAPELVAEAILEAAEHPRRSIVVGGAGKLQSVIGSLLPTLTDRIVARVFTAIAVDRSRPPQEGDGVYQPGPGGQVVDLSRNGLESGARTMRCADTRQPLS